VPYEAGDSAPPRRDGTLGVPSCLDQPSRGRRVLVGTACELASCAGAPGWIDSSRAVRAPNGVGRLRFFTVFHASRIAASMARDDTHGALPGATDEDVAGSTILAAERMWLAWRAPLSLWDSSTSSPHRDLHHSSDTDNTIATLHRPILAVVTRPRRERSFPNVGLLHDERIVYISIRIDFTKCG
jgi:hypothetical protein